MKTSCDLRLLLIISSAANSSIHFVDFQLSMSRDRLVPPRDWRAFPILQSLAVKAERKRFVIITSQRYRMEVLVIIRSIETWVGADKVEGGMDASGSADKSSSGFPYLSG